MREYSLGRSLYFFHGSGTLPRSARSHRDRLAAPVADVAGTVRRRLGSTESARRVAALCDRLVERQSLQVDGSDVGAAQRSRDLTSLPVFHHACARCTGWVKVTRSGRRVRRGRRPHAGCSASRLRIRPRSAPLTSRPCRTMTPVMVRRGTAHTPAESSEKHLLLRLGGSEDYSPVKGSGMVGLPE